MHKTGFSTAADALDDGKPPLFRVDIVLAIPAIVMRPSLEDVQASLNKAVQIILRMTENVPQWQHLVQQQMQQQKVSLVFSVWNWSTCVLLKSNCFQISETYNREASAPLACLLQVDKDDWGICFAAEAEAPIFCRFGISLKFDLQSPAQTHFQKTRLASRTFCISTLP